MNNPERKRINSLTGIQVSTFLLIFLWHADFPKPAIDIGARGCEILYLISGFLIAYNHFYDETDLRKSLCNALKRYLKYLPLHLTTLIAAKIIINNSYDLFATILNGLLLQSWAKDVYVAMSYNGAAWFLSALLFCYFSGSVFMRYLRKYDGKILFSVTFLIRFLFEYLNSVLSLGFNIHTFAFVRMLEFLMGMELYSIFSSFEDKQLSSRMCSVLEILSFVIYVLLCRIFNDLLPRSMFVLFFCPLLLIFSFDRGILSKILSFRIFSLFKGIQFQFYMWHINIINLVVLNIGGITWYIKTALMFVMTIAVSLISKYADNIIYRKVDEIFPD